MWWDATFEAELDYSSLARDLSLKMKDVEVNLEFFRCLNLDSSAVLYEDSDEVRRCELNVSNSKSSSISELKSQSADEDSNFECRQVDGLMCSSLDGREDATWFEVDK